MLSIFEPKIAIAVNEHLGIKNDVTPFDQNGRLNINLFLDFKHITRVGQIFCPSSR